MNTNKPSIRHPNYVLNEENWLKWRLAYEGGDRFLRKYLQKFSKREDNFEYANRLSMSYVPAFAKAAINEIKNSIYRRMSDVARVGGSDNYQNAMAGINGGVDYLHNSMNTFMGDEVLSDLLVMRRVGVYIDMPALEGNTKAAVRGARPYLYWYRTEDIYNWDEDVTNPGEYTNIFLGDTTAQQDTDTFLPIATTVRYRHVYIGDDGFVHVRYYNTDNQSDSEDIRLDIKRIPFVMIDINESLMMDIANYQIALTNMASSDVAYTTKAGFPVYVEQYDPRAESPNLKSQTPNQYFNQSSGFDPNANTVSIVNQENRNNIVVGTNSGRKYPIGTAQPGFIHPSAEPLKASMDKQAQMKSEIRELVQLAISNLGTNSSRQAELGFDTNAFEAGLSIIGLKLQTAERKIAEFWAMYEGTEDIAEVSYPCNYQIISDSERIDSANKCIEIIPKIPSKTFQKEMAKRVIRILMQNKVPLDVLRRMEDEIDASNVISIDPNVIAKDFESGFVGLETASQARGYPKGEVEKAAQDHEDRIKRIAISQSVGGGMAETAQARGVGELGANNAAGVQEKKSSLDTTNDSVVRNKQRGGGQ